MARFICGLNYNISSIVELYPSFDFDVLCSLSLKVEALMKERYVRSSSGETVRPKRWVESETSMNGITTTIPIVSSNSIAVTKLSSPNKETNLSKARCFKCQGFGHHQNSCSNRRIVTLRETVEVGDELLREKIGWSFRD